MPNLSGKESVMPTVSFADKPVRAGRYSFYHKLFVLYLLNLADWLCTEALLATGKFFEANPIMRPVLSGFLPTLLLKGLLPLGLSLLCALLHRLSRVDDSRFSSALLNTGIVVYSLVNLWHIVNFLLLFFAF